MNSNEAMFEEDAEKLARQIQDEDPMAEIQDVRMDPAVGGYVISVYDRRTGEQYIVDRYGAWAEKKREVTEGHMPDLIVSRIYRKHGTRYARLRGEWERVKPDEWPGEIRAAVAEGETAGEELINIEPSLEEVDSIQPGRGKPQDYSLFTNYLVLSNVEGAEVWRRILRLANFTLDDQTAHVQRWRELGFYIAPEPRAPLIEPGGKDWDEAGILEEIKDRLLDIKEQGFEAILVGGMKGVTAYAWVLAGVMGLKVITSWTMKSESGISGFSSLGYTELLNYKAVEGSID